MGIVYVLRYKGTKRVEAAKTYQLLIESDTVETRLRFKNEAKIWNGLKGHPNIVDPCGVLEFAGLPFMMSEYVEGGDLGMAISNAAFVNNLEEVCDLGMQFCDGMAYALEHGVKAHLDIKPSNLLLAKSGHLQICDFGIARALDGVVPPSRTPPETGACDLMLISTPTGTFAGSPLYMAPEQEDDVESVDHRADIYSFGLVLFEMLTQQIPHLDRGSQAQSLRTLQNGKMRSLVGKCLRMRREDRFSTFAELREALGAIYTAKTGRSPHKGVFTIPADCLIPRADGMYSIDPKWKHESLMERVEHLIEIEDQDSLRRIIPVIRRQLEKWPTSPELSIAIARAYEDLDEDDLASPYYETAFQNGRTGVARGFAAVQLGLILQRKYEIDQAIEAFKRGVEHDPSYYFGHYALGRAYLACSDIERAQNSFETAVRLNPDDEDSHVYLSRCLNERSGGRDSAIAMLSESLRRIPRSKTIARCLSACMLLNNEFEEAINVLDDALVFSPECIELHLVKVAGLLLQKDLSGALEQEQTAFAFKQTGSFATLISWRGCTRVARNGDWDTCLSMVREWLEDIVFKVFVDDEFNPFYRMNHAGKI